MRNTAWWRPTALITAALVAIAGLTASAQAAGPTGAITGTLTTHSGAAVASATVYVDGYETYKTATTAANGLYSVPDLPAGMYRVRFAPAAASGHPGQYAHDASTWDTAALIRVVAGQTTTVDESLLELGTISGRFTNSSGNGLSASVSASPLNGGSGGYSQTAADGTFTIAVFPGEYRVSFQTSSGTQYAYGKRNYEDAAVITVVAGQTATVNDTQLPTGSLTGRVLKANGTPASGLQVRAYPENGYSASATTNQNGEYLFGAVFPGPHQIKVELGSGVEQWAPQKRSQHEAAWYDVVAGQATTVDINLLPTGALGGRFTAADGTGLANVQVYLADQDGHSNISGSTDANGYYTFPSLLAGRYKVHFSKWDAKIYQHAYGKINAKDAEIFTVTAGATTTVNDTRLPTGSLRITARDGLTGAAIPEFWISVGRFEAGASDGAVTFTDIPVGTYTMWGSASGAYESVEDQQVTVTAGQQTSIEVVFMPTARLTVTVVDSVTSEPVQDACVFASAVPFFRTGDGCGQQTDPSGQVTISWLRTGDYKLFVYPPVGSGYGAQWVGANGGTGDQRQAKVIHVTSGQTTTGPIVKLDRAGTVTGTVTSETGQPLQYGSTGLLTGHPGVGGSTGEHVPLDPSGHYTINWLGPYQWPLVFRANDHAVQWSGGVANRFDAQTVSVTSGGTTTYNYTMKVGTTLSGTVKMPDGSAAEGNNYLLHAVTGDYMASTWFNTTNQPYQVKILAPQAVKIVSDIYIRDVYWNGLWLGGTSFATANPVHIGLLPLTLDLCVVSSTRIKVCDGTTPRRELPADPTPVVPRRDVPGFPGTVTPRR